MNPQSESNYRGTGCGKAARPDLKGSGEATNRSTWKTKNEVTLEGTDYKLVTLQKSNFSMIENLRMSNKNEILVTYKKSVIGFIFIDGRLTNISKDALTGIIMEQAKNIIKDTFSIKRKKLHLKDFGLALSDTIGVLKEIVLHDVKTPEYVRLKHWN